MFSQIILIKGNEDSPGALVVAAQLQADAPEILEADMEQFYTRSGLSLQHSFPPMVTSVTSGRDPFQSQPTGE